MLVRYISKINENLLSCLTVSFVRKFKKKKKKKKNFVFLRLKSLIFSWEERSCQGTKIYLEEQEPDPSSLSIDI